MMLIVNILPDQLTCDHVERTCPKRKILAL